jgi:putative sporulation protein YyaC
MSDTVYFNTREQYVQWKINKQMLDLIRGTQKPYTEICVVCIGTDRSTGDSFGPLTGHMLSQLMLLDFNLYGTLNCPVHALSLPKLMEELNTEQSLIVAVDAGVGDLGMVGSLGLGYGPVRPGSGLGKSLPSVGDISVTGIVAMGGLAPFIMLQNAPLGLVYNMAEKAFFAIQYALRALQLEKRAQMRAQVGGQLLHSVDPATAVSLNGDLLSAYKGQTG